MVWRAIESQQMAVPKMMDADGSHEARLTDDDPGFGIPFFSPRGDQILFSATHSGNSHIEVMDLDGSHRRRLAGSTRTPGDPRR